MEYYGAHATQCCVGGPTIISQREQKHLLHIRAAADDVT
jgi:hypothetical protein